MFSVYCPGHGCRVLLNMARVWRLDDGDGSGHGGYRMRWVCWCGEQGVTTVRRGHRDEGGATDGTPPERITAT